MDRWGYLILFLLFGAILLIGLQAISSAPVIDDIPELQYIQGIKSVKEFITSDCYGFFRPVKNLLFMTFLWSSPENQAVWHLITLLIYTAATGLALFLFSKILKDKLLALAAAVIWALGPTQISSFIWLSCGNILVMAVSFFSALITYENSQKMYDSGRSNKAAVFLTTSCLFYLAALLSYESAIILPLIILLWDWLQKRSLLRSGKALLSHASLWLVTFIYLVVRLMLTKNNVTVENESFGPISPVQVAFSSAYFIFDHLSLWFWPFGKQTLLAGTFIWGKSATMFQLYSCWILLFTAIAIIILVRKAVPLVSFGLAWFFITFIPLGNIIPLKNGPFSDYYLVIPSFGLALALIGIIRYLLVRGFENRSLSKPFRYTALLICILIICWRLAAAGLCFGWARLWNSETELFRKSLLIRPYSFAAMTCLARTYLLKGRLADAQNLVTEALNDAPWYSNAYNVMGDIYMKKGEYNKAREIFTKAILIKPKNPYPYFALGYIYETFLNDNGKAKRYYYKMLTLKRSSYSPHAAINLSRLVALEGNTDKAIEIMEYALKDTPRLLSADLHYNAAITYKWKGNMPMVQKHLGMYNEIIKDKRSKWQSL